MSTPTRSGGWARRARALRRAFNPDADLERERLDHLERLMTRSASGAAEQIAGVQRELETIVSRLRSTDRRLDRLESRAGQLQESAERQHKMLSQAVRHADWQEELRVVERRLKRRLARIAAGDGPVVVGPWTGEVGFELLYWIPFVTWALDRARVAPERLIIVSRGGAAPWYAHLGGQYVDALSFFSPDEFRSHTDVVEKKQTTVRRFDRQVIRRTLAAAGLRRARLLHPGLMYPLFQPFWKQQVTVRRVEEHSVHRLLDRADVPAIAAQLPSEYVAARFYFSDAFPDTPSNRAFVDAVVTRLSQVTDVVLLNTGIALDDHRDYTPRDRGRIHSVAHLMTPDGNLAVQTAVIAGARAFVGTYGGYAYLAPLYGVKSIAFYSEYEAFFAHHLDFAQRVFHRLGAASLVPLDTSDVDLVQLALGRAAATIGLV